MNLINLRLKIILVIFFAFISIIFFTLLIYQNIRSSKAYSKTAILTLPQNIEAQAGQIIDVPLMLNTGGNKVVGVDFVGSFDTSMLSLVDIIPTAQLTTSFSTFAPVFNGIDFDKQRVISQASISGNIRFSALTYSENNQSQAQILPPFSGSTQLALFRFRTLKEGQTRIIVNKDESNFTKDSNVVSDSLPPYDVLNSVVSTVVNISSSVSPTIISPTLTPTRSVNVTSTPTPTTRLTKNKHILFDGVDDIVRSAKLNNIDKAFTVEFFVKIDSTQRTQSPTKILFANTDNKTGWSIEYKNKTIEFWYTDSRNTWRNIRYSKSVATDVWHHIALSYDGSTARLFVNGRLSNSSKRVGRLSSSPVVYIGGIPDKSYYFGGSIDEIRISSVSRYSANFSVPQRKFTPDSDTVHLYHVDNYEGVFIFDATVNNGFLVLGMNTENSRPEIVDSDSPAK
jgi:hypothetical protein